MANNRYISVRRKIWAWLCIAAWLTLVFGPTAHGFGHEDDHVHVHGTVVHHHEVEPDDSPEDLIASARSVTDTDEKREQPKQDDTHGFDADAHFMGSALPTPLPALVLLEPLPADAEPSFPAVLRPHAVPTGIALARGPPSA